MENFNKNLKLLQDEESIILKELEESINVNEIEIENTNDINKVYFKIY